MKRKHEDAKDEDAEDEDATQETAEVIDLNFVTESEWTVDTMGEFIGAHIRDTCDAEPYMGHRCALDNDTCYHFKYHTIDDEFTLKILTKTIISYVSLQNKCDSLEEIVERQGQRIERLISEV